MMRQGNQVISTTCPEAAGRCGTTAEGPGRGRLGHADPRRGAEPDPAAVRGVSVGASPSIEAIATGGGRRVGRQDHARMRRRLVSTRRRRRPVLRGRPDEGRGPLEVRHEARRESPRCRRARSRRPRSVTAARTGGTRKVDAALARACPRGDDRQRPHGRRAPRGGRGARRRSPSTSSASARRRLVREPRLRLGADRERDGRGYVRVDGQPHDQLMLLDGWPGSAGPTLDTPEIRPMLMAAPPES